MIPLRQITDDTKREEPRVLPLRPMPDVTSALRSMFSAKASPTSEFAGAFELVARAAEAMENAERHARSLRADAIKYFEEMEADLSAARSEASELRSQREAQQATIRSSELRAREAEISARELETKLLAAQQQLSAAEAEVASSKKWLAYFDTELAARFTNASRALEEMGDLSFGAAAPGK